MKDNINQPTFNYGTTYLYICQDCIRYSRDKALGDLLAKFQEPRQQAQSTLATLVGCRGQSVPSCYHLPWYHYKFGPGAVHFARSISLHNSNQFVHRITTEKFIFKIFKRS